MKYRITGLQIFHADIGRRRPKDETAKFRRTFHAKDDQAARKHVKDFKVNGRPTKSCRLVAIVAPESRRVVKLD